jgi:hypothetical protein
MWKSIVYNLFCRDGIYFDKILVSEYRLYGVYISQLIRYAGASSNYSDFLKRHLHLRNRVLDQGYTKIRLIRSLKKSPLSLRLKVSGCHYNSIYNNTWTKQVKQLSNQRQSQWRKCQKHFYVTHWQKKFLTFWTSLSLYIFTIWKCIVHNFFCRDGIYFDKILVSEYKLYGVYISQLIRYARASSNYSDFLKRHLHLRNRLLDQGYEKIRLIRSLKKFILVK